MKVENAFEVPCDPDGVIMVVGDDDTSHAQYLATAVRNHTRSEQHATTIDLAGVTHLGSAAVRVLADAQAHADENAIAVALSAPPGSDFPDELTDTLPPELQ